MTISRLIKLASIEFLLRRLGDKITIRQFNIILERLINLYKIQSIDLQQCIYKSVKYLSAESWHELIFKPIGERTHGNASLNTLIRGIDLTFKPIAYSQEFLENLSYELAEAVTNSLYHNEYDYEFTEINIKPDQDLVNLLMQNEKVREYLIKIIKEEYPQNEMDKGNVTQDNEQLSRLRRSRTLITKFNPNNFEDLSILILESVLGDSNIDAYLRRLHGELCERTHANNISSIKELERFLTVNIDDYHKIMEELINKFLYNKDFFKEFCFLTNINVLQQHRIQFIKDILNYIKTPIFLISIIKYLLQYDTSDNELFYNGKNGTIPMLHPIKFINVDDNIKDKIKSTVNPIDFSTSGRTSPLVVIGDDVLLGTNGQHHADLVTAYQRKKYKEMTGEEPPKNLQPLYVAYENGYNDVIDYFNTSTVAVGSTFSGNKVALLEYVTGKLPDIIEEGKDEPNSGNINAVINVLKSKGFKKVYLNSNTAWTGKIYTREAKIKK